MTSEPLAKSSSWPRAIRSLGDRNFRLYWTGQVVSQVGTWMQIVAQGWVVYRITDSAFMLGLVNFIGLVPVLPVSLIAGVLSDRLPRRSLIISTETVLALQALAMAGLIWFDVLQVWHVIVLSFVLGTAAALEQPARLAFVRDLVGDEDLSNAVALNASGYNTARIVGPAIAGLTISWVGESACFFINSVTYLALILALIAIRIPRQPRPEGKLQVVGSLKEGFQYIWKSSDILGLLFIVSVASFLTIPYITLMPVFAKDVLNVGADGLGFLLTTVGIGAILGNFVVAYLHAGRRGKWLTITNVLGPLFLVWFCLTPSFYTALGLVFLVGSSNAIRTTLANSLIQLNSIEEYQGRVMSIFNLLFNGSSRVGALIIGGLAEFSGAPQALGISAAISVMIGLIIHFRMSNVRQLP